MMFYLCFLAIVATTLAAKSECNTKGNTESCCTDVIGSSLCANVTWVPAKKAIDVSTSFGALHLLEYEFSKNNTHFCAGQDTVKACVSVANFTVSATGCCGCLHIDLSLGPLHLTETTGCFAFGTPHCAIAQCDAFNSCDSCDSLPNCGYCAASQSCMSGTQAGPQSGTCAADKWLFHKAQCNASPPSPPSPPALSFNNKK
eukprot:TRINITY_DN2228_c0_g1_i1.p1 TRINITY_DN2228_c0_g1~~TRINITY_DN2228_c0_g1_i1.p1  ORF type:complete len:216 (-),score=44.71 TRINITY_DN2228_c0_g1_i1:29-631(-)